MNILFLSIFTILGLFYLVLGLFVSRGIKTNDDYFLAGRKMGLFPLTFTLIATQVGGGMMLGTAAQSYNIGYWGILYTVGIGLGFLILGFGLASKLREFNVATTAELFELKYNSKFLRQVASILSIITLFGILGAQVVALKSVLIALGLNNNFIFILFWLFIIIYTMIGGLAAVAITDTVQIIFLIFVFGFLFIKTAFLGNAINAFSFSNFIGQQNFFNSQNFSFLTLFPIVFNPMMFSLIEQDLAQRFFSAKTKKIAALAALFSGIFMLVFAFIPVYFGMQAKLNGLFIPAGSNPLVITINNIASNLLLSLVVCALAAAITSTADSLLCAISSNIVQDFDFNFIKINKLKFSKIVTLVVGLLSIIVAYFSNDIIGILIQSYELSISCLFIPIFLCYFKVQLNKNAAILSVVMGFAGFVLFRFLSLPVPKELASLILSLFGYLIGSKLIKSN
ncbi:MAG: hypothetical protein SZ59_C0005G0015 [candidate division TM6 bacterium GW2011_GWF2_28_16]|nr:MAG: hypothetical protein SZ59_C0005G0015 [candidate division TM6 bacterium GW2011_GWF2_28_16]